MCLVTRLVKAIKASKDIICYKVYIPSGINDTFVSPYQGYKMPKLGKRVQTEFNNKVDVDSRLYGGKSYIELGFHPYKNLEDIYTIYKGFHSFKLLSDIEEYCRNCFTDYLIVECTIPKDTKYYKGLYGTVESYCSECIILNKVIDNYVFIH